MSASRARWRRGDESAWAHRQLAIAALADRDPRRASEEARAALALEPEAGARFILAYALSREGRRAEAAVLLPDLEPDEREFLTATFR